MHTGGLTPPPHRQAPGGRQTTRMMEWWEGLAVETSQRDPLHSTEMMDRKPTPWAGLGLRPFISLGWRRTLK